MVPASGSTATSSNPSSAAIGGGSTRPATKSQNGPVRWSADMYTDARRTHGQPVPVRGILAPEHRPSYGRRGADQAPHRVGGPSQVPPHSGKRRTGSPRVRRLAVPRPRGARGSRKGDLGQTRPAPVRATPGPGQPAQRTPARRQRGHHPGARARRARGRGARRSAGRSSPSARTKFQVVALLVREERARVKADTELTEASARPSSSSGSTGSPRSWPRPPPATPSLLELLAEDAAVSDAAKRAASARCIAPPAWSSRRRRSPSPTTAELLAAERRVVPAVGHPAPARQPVPGPRLLRAPTPRRPRPRRLATWELLGPLFRSFEYAAAARRVHAAARADAASRLPDGLELMRHQAQLVAAAADGPPHLPARRRARPRQDRPGAARRRRRPTPSRCWSSSPTSSRPTGPARPRSGRRTARSPSSTATATTSTASPTSWSSTTRSSTGTSAGSATSASAAWSSTRRTSSRTRQSQRSQHVLAALRADPGRASPGRC